MKILQSLGCFLVLCGLASAAHAATTAAAGLPDIKKIDCR